MKSEYCLLLDPALGITAGELAAAWAQSPECREAGECRAGAPPGFPIDLADAVTVALITMGSTLAKDLTLELIKRALDRAGAGKPLVKGAGEVTVETVPDAETGLPLLIRATRKD